MFPNCSDAFRRLTISGNPINLPIYLVAIALFDAMMSAAPSLSFKRIIE